MGSGDTGENEFFPPPPPPLLVTTLVFLYALLDLQQILLKRIWHGYAL
jgi:hypothetical protein